MKQRQTCWRSSQLLAVICFAAAVLVMAAPFRGGGSMTRVQSASVLPLLSTASLVHGASFQARSGRERVECSESAMFRSAVEAKRIQRREIVVRKSVAKETLRFDEPRVGWKHLTKAARADLDRVVAGLSVPAVEIRSTGVVKGDWKSLERVKGVLGGQGAMPAMTNAVVVGNGDGAGDGELEVAVGEGPLALYLVGDFFQRAPTAAQWEALDEVLDYLTLKWGKVRVGLQNRAVGSEPGSAGLGPYFPTERFLNAISRPGA